jgi:hypothetical protein
MANQRGHAWLANLIEGAFAFCSRCGGSSKDGRRSTSDLGRRAEGKGACLVTISCTRLQGADRAIIATGSPMRRVGGLEKERWSCSGVVSVGVGEGACSWCESRRAPSGLAFHSSHHLISRPWHWHWSRSKHHDASRAHSGRAAAECGE